MATILVIWGDHRGPAARVHSTAPEGLAQERTRQVKNDGVPIVSATPLQNLSVSSNAVGNVFLRGRYLATVRERVSIARAQTLFTSSRAQFAEHLTTTQAVHIGDANIPCLKVVSAEVDVDALVRVLRVFQDRNVNPRKVSAQRVRIPPSRRPPVGRRKPEILCSRARRQIRTAPAPLSVQSCPKRLRRSRRLRHRFDSSGLSNRNHRANAKPYESARPLGMQLCSEIGAPGRR